MGMFTELTLNCELRRDVPDFVINTIKYMLDIIKEPQEGYPFTSGRFPIILLGSSAYFLDTNPTIFKFDELDNIWLLSTRSNIKNYNNEIETFIEWLKPYVKAGVGSHDLYASVLFETNKTPTMYYLDDSLY